MLLKKYLGDPIVPFLGIFGIQSGHSVKRYYWFVNMFCVIVILIVMSSLFVCILHPLAKAAIRERPCNNFLFFCLYFSMKNLHPLAKAVIRERPCNHCYTITNTIVCLPHKLPLLHCLRILSFFCVFSFFLWCLLSPIPSFLSYA